MPLTNLASAINVLVCEILGLKQGENLLILADAKCVEALAAGIAQHARAAGAGAEVVALPADEHLYVTPPRPVADKIRSANAILELSFPSTYYSRALRKAVNSGSRAFFLTGIDPPEFERLMLSADHPEIQALATRVLTVLKRARRVEILSGAGCALWASLGPPWARELLRCHILRRYLRVFFDSPTGLCRKPRTLSSLAGQVSFGPIRASINGRVRIDGAVFAPQLDCPLEEPFELEIRRGRVVKVEPTAAGQRLGQWIDQHKKAGAREVMHFSFGLNPRARLCESVLVSERVFGGVTIGLGYGAKGAHTDLIVKSPSVWLDSKPLFSDGRLVHPEVLYFPRDLVRPRLAPDNCQQAR